MTEKDLQNGADQVTETTTTTPEAEGTKTSEAEAGTIDKGPNRQELMRELSKEYGINLFDADGIKAFKEYQESQKTEIEKMREQLEAAQAKEAATQKALEEQKLNLLRIQHGIGEEKFGDFLAIANAKVNDTTTIEQAFEQTVKEYGGLFVTEKQRDVVQLGVEVNPDSSADKNVKTFDEQVFDAFLKRRK